MKRLFLCLPLLLLLTACAPAEARQQFFAMDTTMTVTLYGKGGADALTAVQQEVFRLDALFSRTKPGSDVSRLNANAGALPQGVEIDQDTGDLLSKAASIGEMTDGALDVTIAPVMDAWGFGAASSFQESEFRVPTQAELDKLLPLVDSGKLHLDGHALGRLAWLDEPGMAVDLGAVAKGYTADKVRDLLLEAGVTSALLDLGGNVTVMGTKADGGPWRVGIKDPAAPASSYCILSLSDQTASTSGGYERNFVENGITYHHIIDPHTGYPAESGLLAVTAVSADGTLADALSTACFVLGVDKALDLWRDQGEAKGFDLVLVGTGGHVWITEGLEPGLDFLGEEAGYTYEIVRR